MDEKTLLLDLKQRMEIQLSQFEDQLIFSDPHEHDEEYRFLIRKAANYRDTLLKINNRLLEL
jgi:hypothetical protein